MVIWAHRGSRDDNRSWSPFGSRLAAGIDAVGESFTGAVGSPGDRSDVADCHMGCPGPPRVLTT